MAVEHEIVGCTDCAGNGILKGERCSVCNGQGFVRHRGGAAPAAPATAEYRTKKEAQERLVELGVEFPVRAKLETLVELIRAAEAPTEDGDETSAEDPDGQASGEADAPS